MTPLIPEDPAYESLNFFMLRQGLKTPLDFKVREDGNLILAVERNVFHKESCAAAPIGVRSRR
jgi:hypothetical protein